MDRHRGDRYGSFSNNTTNTPYNQESYHNRRSSRFSDGPSRFSDAPVNRYSTNGSNTSSNYDRRSPNNFHHGGGGGGHRPFDSPPRHPPPAAGAVGVGEFGSLGGGTPGSGVFPPLGGGGAGFGSNYQALTPPTQPLSGHKRGYPFAGRGSSPDRFDGGSFAKLFVGSVPRTVTEEDIRPLFEQHGKVIEVALIKDKRTGQQQGCCFVKYATSEEADRAIRALHNQHTLPGGVGPIQVRYADGERERLGAVEYKLFVGSLDKQATEKEVEEIFSPYGHVEDVYLMRDEMKQSRGCGFVKYSHREMALAAINALNGIYRMRGCDQPLTVRFADPKRPRPGDSRGSPAFGGPGFGPRFQAPGPRPVPNFGDPMGDRGPPNAWHPMSTQNMGPSSDAGARGFGSRLPPRSGDLPLNQAGPLGGPSDGAPPGHVSSTAQNFNQHLQQLPPVSQQISPLQKPLQSPQHLPPLQLHPQVTSYSQTQTSHAGHAPPTAGQTPFTQAPPSQQYLGMSGQLSASQPQLQQGASAGTPLQAPLNINLQSHSGSAGTNQQQIPAPVQPQMLQPLHQSPSQLAQMLSQQTQTLQATFQSSQQAFSQLQQQLQMMQPSNQGLTLQQSPQPTKQQWPGIPPQTVASTPLATLAADIPPSTSAPVAPVIAQPVAPVKCNWTEHTSLEGFKYYYNSVTRESRWEKPEELTLLEQPQQQQLQQKPPIQQPQTQSNPQVLPTQQVPQAQQMSLQAQFQTQFRHQQQLQQPSFPSSYAASGVRVQQDAQELGYTQLPAAANSVNDPTRFQAAQEWMWKNKAAGSGT
ncbi:flowering time control protein FCA isoform X2 [Hevea brasiliensis]|uniref:flowering time control protein FCA isoform X2 n=1 Tax=Hevea brasiliensis TaxID=3981 RepID=UPI0025FB07EF|nr:flowering time control protein FCA isoform X2 [Hevea brasiliensis]